MPAPSTSKRDYKPNRGVAEIYSSLVIVAMVLALSYFAYAQVPRPTPSGQNVFRNSSYEIFGSPSLVVVEINSSASDKIVEFALDDASSGAGILVLEGARYHSIQSLCTPGGSTFFSVYAEFSGSLSVSSSGVSWIDGHRTSSMTVRAGWHELIISNSGTCAVILPGGEAISSFTARVSSIPVVGQPSQASFWFYLPFGGGQHQVRVVFLNGIDSFEIQ